MKVANLWYGVLFVGLAWLVHQPSFIVPIMGIEVPIPNPLFIFRPLGLFFAIVGIIVIASAFVDKKPKKQAIIIVRKRK